MPNKLGKVLCGIGTIIGMAVLHIASSGAILALLCCTLLGSLRLLQLSLLKPFPIESLLDADVSRRSGTTGILETELPIGNGDDGLVLDD